MLVPNGALEQTRAGALYRTPPVIPINEPGRAASGAFPAVPTLLTTRLQMELLLADRAVELKAAAGILLNDLGATLEIFRRAGEDCDPACGQRPLRLEDCLASLGTDVWMEVVCAHAVERAVPGSARPEQLSLFWEHGRQMAYVCWLLAQQEDEFCPEEAYLLGLLHEAAALPALLGWVAVPRPGGRLQPETEEGDQARLVALLAHWYVPAFLQEFLLSPAEQRIWHGLLQSAHRWPYQAGCLLRPTA